MSGQIWSENTLGGYAYSDNLSKELRTAVQPGLRFRQLCDIKDPDQQQRHKGAKFHWNVYSDVETAGAQLDELTKMPETNTTITQGELSIAEYGNSVPYTGVLDDLSEQPIKEIIHKVLKNDCKKTLDRAAAAQFALTPLRVVPVSGTSTTAVTLVTTGTATETNDVAMGKGHVKAIVSIMKERNIPTYSDDDYACIGWPSTFDTLKGDLESIKQYHEMGFGHIMRGEIGRYESCRFVEQTNVPKTSMSTAAAAWSNAKSNWAIFTGADNVAEAIAIPEEIRGKLPGDCYNVVPC
jgi:N4-gp56 family major capsid protein